MRAALFQFLCVESIKELVSFDTDKVWNMTVVSLFGVRSENKVTINFINRDGEKITVKASPGDTLLDVVVQQDLDIDGYGELNTFWALVLYKLIL